MVVGFVGLGAAVVTTVLANTGKKASATTGAIPLLSPTTKPESVLGSLHIDATPQGMWLTGSF